MPQRLEIPRGAFVAIFAHGESADLNSLLGALVDTAKTKIAVFSEEDFIPHRNVTDGADALTKTAFDASAVRPKLSFKVLFKKGIDQDKQKVEKNP
jgi:hypothetical protein